MGMFDTLNLECPYCGHINQMQTKDRACILKSCYITDIQPEIFNDLKRVRTCEVCEGKFVLYGRVTTIAFTRKYDESIDFYDKD